MAHNLVWEVCVGPIPDGKEVNHKDLRTSNNRLLNLELLTKSGNIQHSYDNGRTKPWSHAAEWRPGRFTLTADQIAAILARRAEGAKFIEIKAEFGISISHAHRLCSREATA